MKIVALGDTHGHNTWKTIINDNQDADKFVFIGDYFDSFDIDAEDQINNFLDICQFKQDSDKEVILLIGNHDYHYFKDVGDGGTSGYNHNYHNMITHAIEAQKDKLQVAYQYEGLLFTHAGVSETYLKDVFGEISFSVNDIAGELNDLWRRSKGFFHYSVYDAGGYGQNVHQTPIWIRPEHLMLSSKNLRDKYVQIVGHTHMKQIDIEGKATGKKYFFIDTLPKEYLIINVDEKGNKTFETGKLVKEKGEY